MWRFGLTTARPDAPHLNYDGPERVKEIVERVRQRCIRDFLPMRIHVDTQLGGITQPRRHVLILVDVPYVESLETVEGMLDQVFQVAQPYQGDPSWIDAETGNFDLRDTHLKELLGVFRLPGWDKDMGFVSRESIEWFSAPFSLSDPYSEAPNWVEHITHINQILWHDDSEEDVFDGGDPAQLTLFKEGDGEE